MIKKVLQLVTLSLCLALPVESKLPLQAVGEAEKGIKTFLRNIADYESRFTQEKVYVQLDNDAYFTGETIWFKLYVVRASNLSPCNMSKVAYIELLTPEGVVEQRKTLRLVNGQGWGSFQLNELLHTGFFEIRAYTRPMLNWGESVMFSRVVPVFDKTNGAATGDFHSLHYFEGQSTDVVNDYRQKFSAEGPTSKVEKGRIVSFYPEGGNRIAGLPSEVAFRVTDKKGNPIQATLTAFNSQGQALGQASVEHEGMGRLLCQPAAAYVVVSDSDKQGVRVDLPPADAEGCVMHAEQTADGVQLTITPCSSWAKQTLGLSATCRAMACFFDTLVVDKSAVKLTIPRTALRDGVNQVTLFTSKGAILSERLVWAPERQPQPMLTVEQNARQYSPFSPVVLNLLLADAYGNPEGGVFALSVRDAGGELVHHDGSMKTDLLLTSDLRGYIANPSYYFENDDEVHRQAIDLLLSVQGWRRYDWKKMAGVVATEMKQPIEEGELLDGHIVDLSNAHRPIADADVNLLIYIGNKTLLGEQRTDSAGHFAMLLPTFYGEALGHFSIEKGKTVVGSRVMLNRSFRISSRAYNPLETKLTPPKPLAMSKYQQIKTFEWVDSFKGKIHPLPEAKVTAKKHDSYSDTRYNYNGGEETGLNHASIYYNMEDEIEQMEDRGEDIPSIKDWLEDHDKKANMQDGHYGGLPYRTFVNNEQMSLDDGLAPIYCDEVKSIIIASGPQIVQSLAPQLMDSFNNKPFICILIYTLGEDEPNYHKYHKGQRNTAIHGYAVPAEFFSPNYRGDDLPYVTDYRRTLYWAPNVIVKSDGRTSVSFFTNARDHLQLHISAEGFALKGGMIEFER